jgi:dihydroorotase
VQRVFGLVGKGRIAAGYDGDFTVIDRKGSFTVTEDWVESRCGWSPFTGMDLRGRVIGTVVRGHVAMWEGQLGNQAVGEPLRFAGCL